MKCFHRTSNEMLRLRNYEVPTRKVWDLIIPVLELHDLFM
jgi:hypothetical protein